MLAYETESILLRRSQAAGTKRDNKVAGMVLFLDFFPLAFEVNVLTRSPRQLSSPAATDRTTVLKEFLRTSAEKAAQGSNL